MNTHKIICRSVDSGSIFTGKDHFDINDLAFFVPPIYNLSFLHGSTYRFSPRRFIQNHTFVMGCHGNDSDLIKLCLDALLKMTPIGDNLTVVKGIWSMQEPIHLMRQPIITMQYISFFLSTPSRSTYKNTAYNINSSKDSGDRYYDKYHNGLRGTGPNCWSPLCWLMFTTDAKRVAYSYELSCSYMTNISFFIFEYTDTYSNPCLTSILVSSTQQICSGWASFLHFCYDRFSHGDESGIKNCISNAYWGETTFNVWSLDTNEQDILKYSVVYKLPDSV